MSDQNKTVDFLEDPAKYRPAHVENEIKGVSIEAWFYKKIPGSIQTKRLMLLIIVVLLLLISARFILLAYMNTSEDRIRQDFEQQIRNTQIN